MTNERIINVIRAPHISEKSARIQESANQYVFEVASDATKADVKTAVEKMFNVKVESVQVVNVKGKVKGFKGRLGRRDGWRKAYVRLGEGQSIDLVAKA
jgi:large subunit ribosomal protein L23